MNNYFNEDDLSLQFCLPYPPTLNTYWRSIVINNSPRILLSKKGRQYKEEVKKIILSKKYNIMIKNFIKLDISIIPPDKRKRDIDNIIKPILDSLEGAGLFEDDYLINELKIKRVKPEKGGLVFISVKNNH